jgi:cytokinin riboside 5'-monophosphate phosphoribohydrolase
MRSGIEEHPEHRINQRNIMPTPSYRIAITLTSSLGVDEKFLNLTRGVAATIASHGLGIVYGGTAYGMMFELAQSYKSAGGTDLVGVMAKDLMAVTKGYVPFDELDTSILVDTMEERKRVIIEKADALMILPGGYGTLEEIGTIIGGRVNKLFDKPIAILNIDGFYDELLSFFEKLYSERFSKIAHTDYCFVSDRIEDVLEYFSNYQPSELADKFVS